MEIWDELHPEDIEGEPVLVSEEYYINDISEKERPRVPLTVDHYYGSIEEALEDLKEAVDFGDIMDFQNFVSELFEWRTNLDTKKFFTASYFHANERCLEFLIFSKDRDKNGTFGIFDIDSSTPQDINLMEDEGLMIRKLIYLPENEDEWSVEPIIEGLTLANYYMNKGYAVISRKCLD